MSECILKTLACRVVADVWDFQAKSGSSGSCPVCLHFLEKIAVHKCLGKRLEVPDLLPCTRGQPVEFMTTYDNSGDEYDWTIGGPLSDPRKEDGSPQQRCILLLPFLIRLNQPGPTESYHPCSATYCTCATVDPKRLQ